jgi:putative FmdB family regulatory protein
MPTYDYACEACDHVFELFQSISESPKRKCPACGKPKLRRLIGVGGGIIFKGSGFYATDYRSDSYKRSADAEKKSAEKKATDGAKDKATGSEKPHKKPKSDG